MNANPQGEERRLPARVAWPGALLVAAGILTPLASIMLLHDSGRSLPAAALAVALLSLGVHRLVWWRPDPFQAWQPTALRGSCPPICSASSEEH
jgi:hypothetical protein